MHFQLLGILLFSISSFAFSQTKQNKKTPNPTLLSGPMLGWVSHMQAYIWASAQDSIDINLILMPHNSNQVLNTIKPVISYTGAAYVYIFEPKGLTPGTKYQYKLTNHGRDLTLTHAFYTTVLWQWRTPAPDFSFLMGSCTYINDPPTDRPGKPYGSSSEIFSTMANQKADFMLWLGDNTYFRETDYSSTYGMAYRYRHTRADNNLKNFLSTMPHIATWDDHDFGPNDSDGSFLLKNNARNLFMQHWPQPNYGQNNQGIYTQWSFSDCDFFLLDGRYFRHTIPSDNQKEQMFGHNQLFWLQQALLNSQASFKFLVSGSQWINALNQKECFKHFPDEFHKLFNFIKNNQIKGVVLLSGDRHFSEIIVDSNLLNYALYDVTCSPLTSGVATSALAPDKPEAQNPQRVKGSLVKVHNFGHLSVTGERGKRQLIITFKDAEGKLVSEHLINQTDLKP